MKALGHPNFVIKSDSKVITDHVEKESEAKKPEIKMYLDAVRAMEKYFKGFTAIHIPRSQNEEADKLAKAAACKEPLPPDVFYEKITKPSTKQEKSKTDQCHSKRRLAVTNHGISSRTFRTFGRERRKKNVPKGKKLHLVRR